MWEQETFIAKAGQEILNQMYAFNDKKDRPICLIPEVTAIIQEEWQRPSKSTRLFYVSRCYRYEKPQLGRYREFTQFGIELLNGTSSDKEEVIEIAKELIGLCNIENNFSSSIKRGLSYYIEDGFEVECPKLGAQKQVLGGGRYLGGIGFAIGIDRLLLAIEKENEAKKANS